MTENRVTQVPEDEFDARIARYLRWESAQVRGVPDGHDVAVRIAAGSASRRWVGSPTVAWVAVLLALLLVAAAVFVASNQDNKVVVVPPSPTAPSSPVALASPTTPPTAPPSPRPTLPPGPCGTGRVEIQAATTGELPADARAIDAPTGSRIAMALENDAADGGTIVIAEPDRIEPRVVATFTGEDLASQGAVQVVAWSRDGSSLLLWAGRESLNDQLFHCGNLWTVATDGSAAARITDFGPGEVANTAGFAPSGSAIAYATGSILHVLRPSGEIQVDFRLCLNGPWPLQWSPDETRILVMCGGDDSLAIVNLETGDHRRVVLPAAVMGGAWRADGLRIKAAYGDTVPGLDPGPLSIFDLDPDTGGFAVRVLSQGSTEWVLGAPTMSPDGRWLLALGGGDISDQPYRTYVIDTATGQTRIAPFQLLMEFGFGEDFHVNRPAAIWLEGNDRVLVEDRSKLFEVDLRTLTRTDVGSVPAQDFAFYPVPR